MDETVWPGLEGKEIQFRDRTWELSGTVAIQDDGEMLALHGRDTEGSARESGTFYFTLQDPPQSLRAGDIGNHFDRFERTKRDQYAVLETEGRTYRYRLSRLEFD